MSRPLTVFLPVPLHQLEAVEDVLLDEPGHWLHEPRAAGPGVWRTSLRVGPVERPIACQVGEIRDEPGSLWRDLSWNPVAQAGDRLPVHELLPHFSGEIGLHRARGVLVLTGSYAVPGGRLGEITDAVALSGVARATGTWFLAGIVERAAQSHAVTA